METFHQLIITRPAIFGFWDDLNPINDNCNSDCAGNIFYNGDDEKCIIWFDNVAHWVSEGFENTSYSFQVIFYSNGDIDINYLNVDGNYSAIIGIQNQLGVQLPHKLMNMMVTILVKICH